MPTLPTDIMDLMTPFSPAFTQPTWRKAQQLLIGAILTPGVRTVTAALRAIGLAELPTFSKYHQVLNRAPWSARRLSGILLGLIVDQLVGEEQPILVAPDETIERRWGAKIEAKGVYRDPVRSSQSHFVKAMGLRWIVLCVLAELPWSPRRWALPFLTALAPSERYYTERGRGAKTLTERAGQMLIQLRRWLPDRRLTLVADQTYAALAFLDRCRRLDITAIVRFRLDAALYEPAPPRQPKQRGGPRKKGERLPALKARLVDPATQWRRIVLRWYDGRRRVLEIATGTAVWYHPGKPVIPHRWVLIRDPRGQLEPRALLSTDQALDARQIVATFLHRWQVEVTFEEVRAHLGVETQRQWSPLAIARTTPVLMGLFSWLTLLADRLHEDGQLPTRSAAWYHKAHPTFSDVIALARRQLWPAVISSMSRERSDIHESHDLVSLHLLELLCYA